MTRHHRKHSDSSCSDSLDSSYDNSYSRDDSCKDGSCGQGGCGSCGKNCGGDCDLSDRSDSFDHSGSEDSCYTSYGTSSLAGSGSGSDCFSDSGSSSDSDSDSSDSDSIDGDDSPRKKVKPTPGKSMLKRFNISWGPDIRARGKERIYVGKNPGATIALKQGYTYYFVVNQEPDAHGHYKHAFVLTDSNSGPFVGIEPTPIPHSFRPLTHGTASFKVHKDTPKVFHYQCAHHEHEGGYVIVQ